MSSGGPKPSSFFVERQLLTRLPATPALPTTLSSNYQPGQTDPGQGSPSARDGLVISNLMALVVSVYPWTGATLSGAGNLYCWVFNTYQNQWTRAPGLDIDMSDATSAPAYTAPAFSNVSRLGLLINWLASSVTVSAGTDLLVRIDGFTSVGAQAI